MAPLCTTPAGSRELRIVSPPFVDEVLRAARAPLCDDQAKMALALALARRNMSEGGGPFAALVLRGTELVAAGVNRVLDTGLSIAHAEILALCFAERALGTCEGRLPEGLTLVTTTEPCCQCFGAIYWSGLSELLSGATSADAEAIGFDEGPKPSDWELALGRRGTRVKTAILRGEARQLLCDYSEAGGPIYGAEPRPSSG